MLKTFSAAKTFAAALGFLVLAAPLANAAPYVQPYTASFGLGQTGQNANVVFYAFDAAGVCRVGPATYVNAAGAIVAGPNNEPASAESKDYTGTGGTGAYFTVLPLDTSWGALHIKAVITGQPGVVAEGSLVNRGSDVADGYTPALSSKLNASTGSGGSAADTPGTTTLLKLIGTPAGVSLAADIAAVKADTGTLANHQKGRFTYNPATHALQLLQDDGVTPLGSPLTLMVDSAGNITSR